MSGHSKWKQIKHKKALNDMTRGKVLTKYAKLLQITGKKDPNPETNTALRSVIMNAKGDGVPKENIDRILKKISGESKETTTFTEAIYEGFAPGGVPVLVTALTDNVNRAYASIRTAFMKNGGNLGTSGSVHFLFNHIGIILINSKGKTEDEIFEAIMESGAEDFQFDEAETLVSTEFLSLAKVRDALESKGFEVIKASPQYRAKDPTKISDIAILEKIEKFLEAVEELEDTDEVFLGAEIDE